MNALWYTNIMVQITKTAEFQNQSGAKVVVLVCSKEKDFVQYELSSGMSTRELTGTIKELKGLLKTFGFTQIKK